MSIGGKSHVEGDEEAAAKAVEFQKALKELEEQNTDWKQKQSAPSWGMHAVIGTVGNGTAAPKSPPKPPVASSPEDKEQDFGKIGSLFDEMPENHSVIVAQSETNPA